MFSLEALSILLKMRTKWNKTTMSRVVLIVLCWLSAGCQVREERNAVILEIEGQSVGLFDFESYVKESLPEGSSSLSPELLSTMLQEFIDEQLLLKAAEDERIHVSSEEVHEELQATLALEYEEVEREVPRDGDLVRRVIERVKVQKLVERHVLVGIDVTDEEVQIRYTMNRALYRRSEMVEISQVLLETAEIAQQVHAALMEWPRRFGETARKHSTGPEAERGGYMGAFRRGELPPSFEEQVFGLRQGQISDVVNIFMQAI